MSDLYEPDLHRESYVLERSILPVELQGSLRKLAAALRNGRDPKIYLNKYVAEIKKLPAASVIKSAGEIQEIARLYRRYDMKPPSLRQGGSLQFWTKAKAIPGIEREPNLLSTYPDLCFLYIFHGDGYLREAALNCFKSPIDSPFVFAAITVRLNDWVLQVRTSAGKCAGRLFPQIPPRIAAEASFFLVSYAVCLKRWGEGLPPILEETLYRNDVLAEFVAQLKLKLKPVGRVGQTFKEVLKRDGLDCYLRELAGHASLPIVRSIAYEVLILGYAKWVVGYHYELEGYISYIPKRIPDFEQRAVKHDHDVETLIVEAARDRAVVVRKIAGRGLIDHRHELSSKMVEIAKTLAQDKSQSVRSRAEFYLRKLSDN